MREALARGRSLLTRGAAALEAVAEVVAAMERHGAFDAGCGAVLTREGTAELDAGLMDGATLRFCAVACVGRLAEPVRAARLLLEHGTSAVRLMCGPAAEAFAATHGLALVDNEALRCARERRRFEALRAAHDYHVSHPFLGRDPQGTVGCVARDRQGRLAAATSTGGTPFRPVGRIGDSPLPGCGFYATPGAAASATGWGEAIATVLLCGGAVRALETGTAPVQALRDGLQALHAAVRNDEGAGATAGLIALGQNGAGAWAFTTPRMARAGWREGHPPWYLL